MVFVLYAIILQGQSVPKLLEIAAELFDAGRYIESIEFYQKAIGRDRQNEEARYQLGLAQMNTLQYQEARETFFSLYKQSGSEYKAKALYHYAFVLKLESQYALADSFFNEMIVNLSAEQSWIELARKQKAGCQLAINQEKQNRGFEVTLMDNLNSKFHDFGATVNPRNKNLVFATTRTISGEQYEGSQYAGLLPDIVAFEFVGKGRWRNTTSREKLGIVNSEWSEGSGRFTADGISFYFSSCKGANGSQCEIFVTYYEGGRWTEPLILNDYINEPRSENKQPSISFTGDTLFFASDRVGGYGGSDIWMSLRGLDKESWSPAINMGEVINTVENEISPYYSSASESLVFASNGQIGYGGYDLYLAQGVSFFEPEIYNLGAPFNTAGDDLYFSITDSIGYLTSNRSSRSVLDLYYFRVPKEQLFLSLLISGETLIESRIASRFVEVETLDLYAFRAEDFEGYQIFDPVKREKPKPEIIVKAEVKDSIKKVKRQLAIANPKKIHPMVPFHTKEKLTRKMNYESIYFAFGSHYLDEKAELALKSLVDQLSEKDFSKINILAYTDPLGTDSFNLSLSRGRGNRVMNYLVESGIGDSLISVKARGEIVSTNSSWFQRIFQRRVEIIIESKEPLSMKKANYFMVKKDMTVTQVAETLAFSSLELQDWNGFSTTKLNKGDLVRVHDRFSSDLRLLSMEDDLNRKYRLHRVREDETLSKIAGKYKIPEELIQEVNIGKMPLEVGDEILVFEP